MGHNSRPTSNVTAQPQLDNSISLTLTLHYDAIHLDVTGRNLRPVKGVMLRSASDGLALCG